jgi:hypothetical protein
MFETYGELKTGIANWLNRTETDSLGEYVRLAEQRIYRGLRVDDNAFKATYNNAGWAIEGFATEALSDGIAHNLPPNFVSLRQITWNGMPLDPVTDTALSVFLKVEYDAVPSKFCRVARKLQFSAPIPTDPATWADTDVMVVTYYGTESLDSYPTYQVATNPVRDPAVDDVTPEGLAHTDNNTTRMLQRNPDIYLHGALYFAGLKLQDDDLAAKYKGLFTEALAELKAESKRERYAGGTKQIRSAYDGNISTRRGRTWR